MKIDYNQIKKLANKYQTPMYLYDQETIEENIKTIKQLCTLPNIKVNYATKANNNLHLLKLIKANQMKVDCTGYGEFYINKQAGFDNDDIYVVANNLCKDELKQLTDENLIISVDSVDQLKLLNAVAPQYQKLMIRVNPSFGAGDNDSIITGGVNHKFGIDIDDLEYCLNYIKTNNLKLIGINNHVGSLNLDYQIMIKSVSELLSVVTKYKLNDLQIINFGGGFGIDYNHQTNQQLDFKALTVELNAIFTAFITDYPNPDISLEFEPGRYIVASSSVLVGTVTSVKRRGDDIYIGTDLGFSQLARPVMYNSYHHVEFITDNTLARNCHVVGNMCESGDYICKDRKLIIPDVGDLIIVYDTGAYGYSMSSNFNNRLRAIELLTSKGKTRVIRNRQTIESLLNEY